MKDYIAKRLKEVQQTETASFQIETKDTYIVEQQKEVEQEKVDEAIHQNR